MTLPDNIHNDLVHAPAILTGINHEATSNHTLDATLNPIPALPPVTPAITYMATSSGNLNMGGVSSIYLEQRFPQRMAAIQTVRNGVHGTGYKHIWNVIQVKRMAIDLGIKWADEGKTINTVLMENGWTISVEDIVLAAGTGVVNTTFKNAKTTYSKVLRLTGAVNQDELPDDNLKHAHKIFQWLVCEKLADPDAKERAEREAAQITNSALKKLVDSMQNWLGSD